MFFLVQIRRKDGNAERDTQQFLLPLEDNIPQQEDNGQKSDERCLIYKIHLLLHLLSFPVLLLSVWRGPKDGGQGTEVSVSDVVAQLEKRWTVSKTVKGLISGNVNKFRGKSWQGAQWALVQLYWMREGKGRRQQKERVKDWDSKRCFHICRGSERRRQKEIKRVR
ncbi:hypothetical protein RRG08_022021 [Elysia crispata]|uniref:Uncharacterized protein n=1 Tax=Elysia crispata TaxID=231223 RepID=A0AAE1D6F0_9GAST|nr:hypothetical protein RRG08_022021 [Elysia crispata]